MRTIPLKIPEIPWEKSDGTEIPGEKFSIIWVNLAQKMLLHSPLEIPEMQIGIFGQMVSAPLTRIRIIFNPQLSFWIQNFHTKRIQIEFACPHASVDIQIHSRETTLSRFAATLVYCSVRDWTQVCLASLSTSMGICFFHSGERIKKYPDSLRNSLDACGRKAVSAKKKLRVQTYPDTCMWTGT